MFREEPEFDCQIHQPINVGTIGHIVHGKTTITRTAILSALLATANSANEKDKP